MKCEHKWVGKDGFVECTQCGKILTLEQFLELLNKPKEKTNARRKKSE